MKQYYLITKINMNMSTSLGFDSKEFEKEYFLNISDMKYRDVMALKETVEKMQTNSYGTFEVEFEEISTEDVEKYKAERVPASKYREMLIEDVSSSSVLIVRLAKAVKEFYNEENVFDI